MQCVTCVRKQAPAQQKQLIRLHRQNIRSNLVGLIVWSLKTNPTYQNLHDCYMRACPTGF